MPLSCSGGTTESAKEVREKKGLDFNRSLRTFDVSRKGIGQEDQFSVSCLTCLVRGDSVTV